MLGWFKKKKSTEKAETPKPQEPIVEEEVEAFIEEETEVVKEEASPADEEPVKQETVPRGTGIFGSPEPEPEPPQPDEKVSEEQPEPELEPELVQKEPPQLEQEKAEKHIHTETVQKDDPASDLLKETTQLEQEAAEKHMQTESVQKDEPAGDHLQEAQVAVEPIIEDTAIEKPAADIVVEKNRETEDAPSSKSLFKRLSQKLSRTRESIVHQMDTLFLGKKEIDGELLDDLEELLITADIGVSTSTELLDYARKKVKRKELSDPASLKKFIKEKLRTYIVDSTKPAELVMPESGPFVIMVVGVNGVGKTTTIGKIAHKFIHSGQSVLLAAGDTFRAAAVSQLKIWGERNGVEVVSKQEGADPSSVAFDAMARAEEENYDVVLVDTAGRLHTQTNLMEELKKIKRVMAKKIDGAPHEILLVIDATTGQNGISQAKLFDEAVGVSGLALTKLDGTAKGGIIANISKDMKIPIRFIGIGEKVEDLRDFDPDEFIEALFGESISDY